MIAREDLLLWAKDRMSRMSGWCDFCQQLLPHVVVCLLPATFQCPFYHVILEVIGNICCEVRETHGQILTSCTRIQQDYFLWSWTCQKNVCFLFPHLKNGFTDTYLAELLKELRKLTYIMLCATEKAEICNSAGYHLVKPWVVETKTAQEGVGQGEGEDGMEGWKRVTSSHHALCLALDSMSARKGNLFFCFPNCACRLWGSRLSL